MSEHIVLISKVRYTEEQEALHLSESSYSFICMRAVIAQARQSLGCWHCSVKLSCTGVYVLNIMMRIKRIFMIIETVKSFAISIASDQTGTWHLVSYYWGLIGQCIIEKGQIFLEWRCKSSQEVFLCYQTEHILQGCYVLVLWHLINVYTVCQSTNLSFLTKYG